MAQIVRSPSPPARSSWKAIKELLRLDFDRRCAYCHIPEIRYGPPGNYHIDHFRPKSHPDFAHLARQYENLYYCCADCNRHKGKTWPQPELQALGFHFLDPCEVDYRDHWSVDPITGALEARSHAAEYMIARLRLDREFLTEWRAQKARYRNLYERAAAGPTTDPELAELLDTLQNRLEVEFGHYW